MLTLKQVCGSENSLPFDPQYTGKPAISSLKTRLLALQALGAIMADLTDNSPDSQAKCAMVSSLSCRVYTH